MFTPIATPVAPYNWPMFTDPAWNNKTSDFYVFEVLNVPETYPNYIQSVYMLSAVNFDITFNPPPRDDETGDQVVITSVQLVSGPTGETKWEYTQKDDFTVNVQGMTDQLSGERFDFLMRDLSIKSLPPFNEEDWIAVVEWKVPPRPWDRLNTYTFLITYDVESILAPLEDEEQTVTVLQYAYWNWEPSLAALEALVEQGEL